jgi:hypothetical protein
MTLLHESGTPLVLIGYVPYPKDIDSQMWSCRFEEFERCEACNLRMDYLGSNPKFRPPRSAPDYGSTWDGELIASRRFREFCEDAGLTGIDYLPLEKDADHFHARRSRVIALNQDVSKAVLKDGPCKRCGQYRIVKWNNPWAYQVREPLLRGFWRSDVLVGEGNTKSPFKIVSPLTRHELETAGLTGFHGFDPVYAPATSELEAALKNYPVLTPSKSERVAARPRPLPPSPDTHPFVLLLAAPAPGFECRSVSDKQRKAVFQIQHDVREAPSSDQLTSARQLLGRSGNLLLEFYRFNDGADLYRGVGTDEVGVRFFPIDQWQGETTAMKQASASLPKGGRPEVLDRAIAFGEPPGSGHHFAIVTKGKGATSIILTNHETLAADEFAPDFNEFLKVICSDPVDLLTNQLGSYVRYRDGKTRQEWIPVEYLPDAKRAYAEKRRLMRPRSSLQGGFLTERLFSYPTNPGLPSGNGES